MKFFHCVGAALLAAAGLFSSAQAASSSSAKHPYLLFSDSEWPALREKMNEPRNAPVKEQILAVADKLIEADPGNANSYKTWAQQGGKAIKPLTWAYIITGDTKYSDALLAIYRHEWRIRGKIDQNQFRFEFWTKNEGMNAALAYDVLWPVLNEEDRAAFGTYVDQYLVWKEKPSFGWLNNIGLGYFSAVGMIALARLDENPGAREILAESIRRLKEVSYPVSILPHPDGAYPEGPLYGDYAMLHLIPFINRYEAITGDKGHGLLEPPFFHNTQRMVETLTGGDGIWAPVYDSQSQEYGAGWGAMLGGRFDIPMLQWMSDYYFERIAAKPVPRSEVSRSLMPAILNRTWDAPVTFPGFPTLAMLPSVNTGSMRSDGQLKPGLMVIVRGFGDKETNMRSVHKDVGSFLLYSRGENFLIDPGYYQPEPEAHNLPEVNGMSVQVRSPSPLVGGEKDDIRVLSIDPTKSYKRGNDVPTPIRRSWVMVADKAVILIDDIQESAEVISRLQAGFATELLPDGKSAIITGKESRLWLGSFGPEAKLTMQGPLDFGKSWIFKELADKGGVSWHRLESAYSSNPTEPMVWVFVPISSSESAPKVSVKRSGQSLTVSVPNHPDVRLEKTGGIWQPLGLTPKPGQM